MKKIFLSLIIALFCTNVVFGATNSYDKYGNKTGSYRQNGSSVNQYDKYGNKTGSYKKHHRDTTLTIDTEIKQEAIKLITIQQLLMTVMVIRQVVTKLTET